MKQINTCEISEMKPNIVKKGRLISCCKSSYKIIITTLS